jgi:hypothetical protein
MHVSDGWQGLSWSTATRPVSLVVKRVPEKALRISPCQAVLARGMKHTSSDSIQRGVRVRRRSSDHGAAYVRKHV